MRSLVVVCTCVCLALTGCGSDGPELGEVSGIVTLDGQPLPDAVVTFVPVAGGSPAIGKTDSSGNYKLLCLGKEGAPVGKHRVSISSSIVEENTTPPAEIMSDDPAYLEQAMGQPSEYDRMTVREKIPAKYNSQTTLEEEVTSGSNTINFSLTTAA